MDSNQIKGLFIVVISALLAVYLGIAAATAQFEAVLWVGGVSGLVFVLILGKNVWALIPASLTLQGTMSILPGSPPPWALGVGITLVMYLVLFAVRKSDFVWRFTWLDAAVLLQIIVIGQAYLRNPTGLLILGGDVAGGKPYFVFAFAILGYLLLSITKPNEKTLKWAVLTAVFLFTADGLLASLADYVPMIAYVVLPIYSNVNFSAAIGGDINTNFAEVRGGTGLAQFGRAMVIPCFCFLRPLACLNPLRYPGPFLLVIAGTFLVLLSGYRSYFAYLGVVYIVSCIARRRPFDIAPPVMLGILLLSVVLVSGQVDRLPFGVQRVLSIFPVEVDSDASFDAKKSSEWRFEMWRMALQSNEYIQNKVLGDGFGFSAREMQAIQDSSQGFSTFITTSQEAALAKGSYHGFHVETIRFTGAVGLLAALILMIAAFALAWRLISYYRSRQVFPYVVYLAVPFLIYPFWSMFIFGSYRTEFPAYIAMLGLLKMLDNLRVQEGRATVPARKEAGVLARISPSRI